MDNSTFKLLNLSRRAVDYKLPDYQLFDRQADDLRAAHHVAHRS